MANNGTTWSELVEDISKFLKQNYAAAEVNPSTILFWVVTGASRLRRQRFANQLARTGTIEGDYLAIFDEIPIKSLNVSGQSSMLKKQKYVEFPRKIVDLDFDAGLHLLTYSDKDTNCKYGPGYTRVKFHRTTPAKAWNYYGNPHEMPSEINPYYFRDNGGLLWLLGLEDSSIEYLQAFVYLNPTYEEINDANIDTAIGLPEDLISILRADIVNMGNFALMMPRDRVNNGNADIVRSPGLGKGQQQILQPGEAEAQQ